VHHVSQPSAALTAQADAQGALDTLFTHSAHSDHSQQTDHEIPISGQ
jgi:hypothetical protein